ncbi:MAG: D-amino acid dehydrogenase [Halofilum sp. (in: g-proteobacteria)]|nr:D-amino acid dehydrogenase [Halofilum sp. (in: g-proteobacteria)]
MHVLVIGGGLTGTLTAWYLAEAGREVTLLDRNPELAAEGSYANGSILHAGHADPWNTPAVIGQLLRWIGREESPLLLRPSRLPFLLRWGLGFLRYSRAHHHARVTAINTRLAVYSRTLMNGLHERLELDYDAGHRGSLKIFRDPRHLEQSLAEARAAERLGVHSVGLDAAGVVELEPALTGIREQLAGGVHFPDDRSGDACRFVRALGAALAERGGRLRLGETVQRIEGDSGGVRAVVTDRGTLTADRYVLAAGVDAPRLARPLRLRLPLEPIKGYSATLPVADAADVPRVPLIDEEHKVVISRLGDRLRVAGMAEFAGFDREIRPRRVEIVLRQALTNFPALAERVDPNRAEPWACLRPVCVDGAPILGSTDVPGLYLNTGPGHLGWTFGAGAARVVADVVCDREPELDLAGLTLDRFR